MRSEIVTASSTKPFLVQPLCIILHATHETPFSLSPPHSLAHGHFMGQSMRQSAVCFGCGVFYDAFHQSQQIFKPDYMLLQFYALASFQVYNLYIVLRTGAYWARAPSHYFVLRLSMVCKHSSLRKQGLPNVNLDEINIANCKSIVASEFNCSDYEGSVIVCIKIVQTTLIMPTMNFIMGR